MNKKGNLTTSFGAPVYDTYNSLTVGNNGPVLLEDVNFVEKMAHFDRERIPERVVHAKGTGAFGYFQPYQSMSDYTCASFLQNPSKKTKILIRFSTVIGFRGAPDTARDPRGFAVRFYTDEGNYDVVGLSFPVFFIRDAISFPDFIHSQKPDPQSNIQNFERIWDFYSLMPECAHLLTWLYSDRGIVKDYRKMDGFGVNTFVWVNKQGKRKYVKYHFLGQAGKEVVDRFEAARLAGEDPDIAVRNLRNAIASGCPAKYEFCVQMMDPKDADCLDFDPLDDTKIWPEDRFPLMKVGMLVLDENPQNFFAQIEQAAFAPSNIVPGIEFSADKMLQGRTFAYRDTQRYRVGTNFEQLPVNRPLVPVCNDMRDGSMTYEIPKGNTNYKPNSLADNCPWESCRPDYPGVYYGGKAVRHPIDKTDDFSQATARYHSLPEDEKARMAEAMAHDLSAANCQIQKRSLELLTKISPDLCQRVSGYLEKENKNSNGNYVCENIPAASGTLPSTMPTSCNTMPASCKTEPARRSGRDLPYNSVYRRPSGSGCGCRRGMMTRERYMREQGK